MKETFPHPKVEYFISHFPKDIPEFLLFETYSNCWMRDLSHESSYLKELVILCVYVWGQGINVNMP